MGYSGKGSCSTCSSDKGDKCDEWNKSFSELIAKAGRGSMTKSQYKCHKFHNKQGGR